MTKEEKKLRRKKKAEVASRKKQERQEKKYQNRMLRLKKMTNMKIDKIKARDKERSQHKNALFREECTLDQLPTNK